MTAIGVRALLINKKKILIHIIKAPDINLAGAFLWRWARRYDLNYSGRNFSKRVSAASLPEWIGSRIIMSLDSDMAPV